MNDSSADLRPSIMTGVPAGTKATGGSRVDFKIDRFNNLIATKGSRYWWSRGALCPCKGNEQTDQTDPTCTLCKGTGWYYFLPERELANEEKDPSGNPIELNDSKTGVSIQVLITNVTKDPQIFEKFGQWIFGVARATAQSPNRICYRDRFKSRDSTMGYSQLIDASGTSEIIVTGMRATSGLWTPVARVNLLRSISTAYIQDEHFQITDTGTIKWIKTPPTKGTLLTIQGEFFPTWIVMDMPYATRDTLVSEKTTATDIAGQFRNMPLHSVIKLDFLTDVGDA
jgi:hypothetical protein